GADRRFCRCGTRGPSVGPPGVDAEAGLRNKASMGNAGTSHADLTSRVFSRVVLVKLELTVKLRSTAVQRLVVASPYVPSVLQQLLGVRVKICAHCDEVVSDGFMLEWIEEKNRSVVNALLDQKQPVRKFEQDIRCKPGPWLVAIRNPNWLKAIRVHLTVT